MVTGDGSGSDGGGVGAGTLEVAVEARLRDRTVLFTHCCV